MIKTIIASTLLMAVSTAMANDVSKMSESDRKLNVGLLYLSQCVYLMEDFRRASEVFDKKNTKEIRKSEGQYQFIDEWSMTKITLTKDVCAIETKSNEINKIARILPEILEAAGGKLSLNKVAKGYWGKPGYIGKLVQDGKPITVKVDIGPEHDDVIFVALFKK